mmetsp:Transcript_27344/g.71666  ORF Transcript_27344/g.71666 Transcript_27344/m.71666 type:complete len:588 (-) Transcript_27344:104-1867(-)
MFVGAGEFDTAYKRIKQDALKGDCTVIIFVAPDTDSICACWILTALLKADYIGYKMMPIADLTDLLEAKEMLLENPGDFQTVVMLNAGGTIDILAEFEAEDEASPLADLTFYLVDAHRPIDLANAYDDGRVVVFDDGATQLAIPAPDEVWNDDDDSDEDEEDPGGGPLGRAKRRRTEKQDGSLSPRSRREARSDRDRRREEYYSATSYGVAASVIMWQLVGDLGRADNHLLWLSIIGLTDQFIQERIDSSMYVQGFERLADDVRRLNADESEAGGDVVKDEITIRIKEDELRFMLLRHWNLLDAMSHSRYVACRLGVWRQSGKQLLQNLLAKMGISIEQSKQQYASLSSKVREQLYEQISHYAHEYHLENCIFPSFECRQGFKTAFSASDLVYSTTGLLEAASENPDEAIDWKANFFLAFDSLSLKNRKLLTMGVSSSMRQHAAILRQVESIVEGKINIGKAGGYRYVIIKDDPDQKYFLHHPTLRRLGLYLMDTFRFGKEVRKKSYPLVLAALNPSNATYIVAGLWSTLYRSEGSVVKNEFGQYFMRAGSSTDARIRMASFDTSVIEIKSDDMRKFFSSLSSLTRS